MRSILLLSMIPFLSHCVFAGEPSGDIPSSTGELLQRLVRNRPRILVTQEDFDRAKALLDSGDPVATSYYRDIEKTGEVVLSKPPVEYKVVGPRLLHVCRDCLNRVVTCSFLFRLTQEERYLDCVRENLRAASEFPDWNPSHFLDTAEMTQAFAVAFDWLYDQWTEEERDWICETIVEKGLSPSLELYAEKKSWTRSVHNWNQVCNGGMLNGALAIAEREPDLALTILQGVSASLPVALAEFSPDGGCIEGPGYWRYAKQYEVHLFSTLLNSLGSLSGLDQVEGLSETGYFPIHSNGPLNETFNYADSGSKIHPAPQLFWLAHHYDRPVFAVADHRLSGTRDPLHLLWYRPELLDAEFDVPLDAHFRRVETAYFRSAWDDPNALFVAVKGGDNTANHSHLDLGTFVLDADGYRWASDLGGDYYNLPGYWDVRSGRWKYFRLNTQSHNTILINGENQKYKARAPITAFHSGDRLSFVTIDLTEGYSPVATSVKRGVALIDRAHVLIQDEIECVTEAAISWNLLTAAEVAVTEKGASLSIGEKHLFLSVLSPDDFRIEVESADPGPPQNRNEGYRKVVVHFPKGKSVVSRILLVPGSVTNDDRLSTPDPPTHLSDWARVE